MDGGVLLGTGSQGMLETPGEDSAQNTLSVSCSGEAGSVVEVQDADGSVLVSYTAPKAFTAVVCSTPEVQQGETYTALVDGVQAASVECTGVVSGSAGGAGNLGGMREPGGMQAPDNMQQPGGRAF